MDGQADGFYMNRKIYIDEQTDKYRWIEGYIQIDRHIDLDGQTQIDIYHRQNYIRRYKKMDRQIQTYCSWVFTKTLTICIIDLYFVLY